MSISDAELYSAEIESLRKRVDERLDQYTSFSGPGADRSGPVRSWDIGAGDCPDRLRDAIRYMLLAPAKRIRPLLVLLAAETCEGNIENALPAACAVEMIHTYSLIHDDLPAMDDDDLRRGRASCHIQFDQATAILAGDALIPLAFEVLSRDVQPVERAVECVRALSLASGPTRLVGGQADDLAGHFQDATVDDLEKIHRRKTGALLTASLKMGAISAGAGPKKVDALTIFGNHLGLAFQIVDDLLDLRGEQGKMGKRTGKDASRGKMTYPALLGEDQSEQRARELIAGAIEVLEPFGEAASKLKEIARVVVERTR